MKTITYRQFTPIFFAILIILSLIALGFSPGMAPSRLQGTESMPGRLVILRADPNYFPARVAPPKEAELGIQSATFNVTYNGFSPEAQAAFQRAVDIWASQITSTVTIKVTANWTPLGPGVLGAAGPSNFFRNFPNAPIANRWYPSALADSLRGADLEPGASDITAFFSSSFANWYFGTDGNPGAGQYDLVSVVLHELGHGLGFVGSMTVDDGNGQVECTGTNGIGCWGLAGTPLIFDQFAENGSGQQLINTALFPNPSAALGTQLTSNNIFFDGPNTRTANGGNPAKLYAPTPFQSGSSFSHLDEIFNGTPNALMTFSLNLGESAHNPGPVTLGIF
ncbi:MAG: hypothetical protein HYR94_19265, partial [Chloroflexi bacterium]|nr:hypothetical protein [Chloroflexota bacterium]